jgi:hypothetical protein
MDMDMDTRRRRRRRRWTMQASNVGIKIYI